MCKAPISTRRRRSNKAISPIIDQEVIKDSNITKYQCALHEAESLPRTVSTGDSDCSSSSSSTTKRLKDSLCPVTGLLSNVLDDYVVLPNVLGEGHYGCVRECIHRSSRQTHACKSIEKCKIGRLDHLQREVHLLSIVNHDGIMKMVDCYEDVDYVHIITEKYTGGELFDTIADNTTDSGCFSERKAARIIKSLLEAVAYLHKHDIVHRDIKPENILFESTQEAAIKLIDFGLSRQHERGEAPMTNPVGTAYYMAPELLKGKYDKACDVWSVGTVAYILLCGYPPFNNVTDNGSDNEIFDSIKMGRFKFPDLAWSDKSGEVKDFIRCLLRINPRKRFTVKEALMHPWIVNLGKKQKKVRREAKVQLRNSRK